MLNTQELVKTIWKESGFRGFYKGLSMNFVKGPIASGLTITTKKLIQREYQLYNSKK